MTITYFHGFCRDILNQFDEKWPGASNDESLFRETIPSKVIEIISRNEHETYDAILIDEGQDFCVEWYSMLCHFLTKRDELVVVCDKKQHIYEIELAWLDKRRRGVEKFGDWIELKKIIRLPEQVARISVEFSERFNLNQDIKIGKIEKRDLWNQFQDHIIWWNIESNWLERVDKAFEILKNNAEHNHPSDMVILLPDRYFGWKCIRHFELKGIQVNHVFEDDDEKRYHRHKKAFWMGDSRLKMSTIHSFKGWEVSNVIMVIPSRIKGDEERYDKLVYTAITRTRENLIVINANARYRDFGEKFPDRWIE